MLDTKSLVKFGSKAFAIFGAARGGINDAKALKAQAREAAAQGDLDEEAQRRQARAQLGEQAAAIAQAGIGYGGTAALVMNDSSLAAELDALNYRYRGLQQYRALRAQARSAKRQGFKLAGGKLLSAVGENMQRRTILSNARN